MTDSVQGFICPHCLVNFATSSKLQQHFLEFHSGADEDEDVIMDGVDGVPYQLMENNEEFEGDESEHGHDFRLTMVKKPRPCTICVDIIWSEALSCAVCQLTCHPKCEPNVTQTCIEEGTVSTKNFRLTTPTQAPQPPKGFRNKVKHHVAKGRGRYVDEDFDLDLTYITERIIAMSFPGSGLETTYRNDLKDVAKMLKTKHQDNYMVINLSERSYDISRFNNQVLDFGWPDHLAPSLERLSSICKSMKSWLDTDPSHVAVVHCKGGKGRTGCVISAFMHYTAVCDSAEDALDRFAMKRFYDRKLGGVTQPSQRRYVYYFSDLLSGKISVNAPPLILNYVIIHGCPDYDGKGGCRPYIKIYQEMTLVHTTRLYNGVPGSERIRLTLEGGVPLKGELLFKCFHKKTSTSSDSIFRVQFHTSVVNDYAIAFGKDDLDDAFKDKRFPKNLKVEFIFQPNKRDADKKILSDQVRRSLLGSDDLTELDPELKRNSYEDFLSGYDTGMPNLPPPIQPNNKKTNQQKKMVSLERFPGPKDDLYTAVSKPLKKKSASTNTSSYTKLTDLDTRPPAVVAEKSKLSIQQMEMPANDNQLSYHEVVLDQRPQLEPSKSTSADEEMWVKVVWKQQQEQRQKQQQSDLDAALSFLDKPVGSNAVGATANTDPDNVLLDYANLVDINTGQAFLGEVKRKEDDSNKIYIGGIGPDQDPVDETTIAADYVNRMSDQQQGEAEKNNMPSFTVSDGSYAEIDVVDEMVQQLPNKGHLPTSSYVNTVISPVQHNPGDDYYNQEAINEVTTPRQQQLPVASKPKDSGDSAVQAPIMRNRPTSRGKQPFKNFLHALGGGSASKSSGHIQSAPISDDDKTKSLATFNLQLDLNRTTSSSSFLKDAWATGQSSGASKTSESSSEKPTTDKKKPLPIPQVRHHLIGGRNSLEEPAMSHRVPASDKRSAPSRPVKRSHSSASSSNNRVNNEVYPLAGAPRGQHDRRPMMPPMSYRQHSELKKVPNSNLSPVDSSGVSRNLSPVEPHAKPLSASSSPVNGVDEDETKKLEKYWYKPNFTREEAVEIISQASPGSFIVRDSQSVLRGYALTIKVSEVIIRKKLKVPPDFQVTSDMCVKHFLLQPDHTYPMGIKLQGWNEKPFKNLAAFITEHCINKLCLPCKLTLPTQDLATASGSSSTNQSLFTTGAACDLVYVGGVDVAGPGSSALLSSAVQQFKSLQLNTANIVNFKATKNGIIITDVVNGMFVKRHYPINTISFCAVDASDTRWDFSNLKYKDRPIAVSNARCFGFVHRPTQQQCTYMCLLFAELNSSEQPVHSVVDFVNQLMVLSQT